MVVLDDDDDLPDEDDLDGDEGGAGVGDSLGTIFFKLSVYYGLMIR